MICAIDCDLRQSYLVTDTGIARRGADPLTILAGLEFTGWPRVILLEVASPLDYTDDKAVAYNKRRWTIWNIAQAARIYASEPEKATVTFRVAPSHVWTKGYDLKTRHHMAKCVQPQKDLREAEAMLWFYNKNPAAWVTWPDFLASL